MMDKFRWKSCVNRHVSLCWLQTDCVCHRQFVSATDCLLPSQTVCVYHRQCGLVQAKKSVFDRHRLHVANKDWLWQTQTVCDRHNLSVTDIYCLWPTQTVCDGYILSMTDTDCLGQSQTVCDSHRQSVTDTDCLWQAQTVCGRHRLTCWTLLNIYYFHTKTQFLELNLRYFCRKISRNQFMHFHESKKNNPRQKKNCGDLVLPSSFVPPYRAKLGFRLSIHTLWYSRSNPWDETKMIVLRFILSS